MMNAIVCKVCGDLLQSITDDDRKTCLCGCISISGGDQQKRRNGAMCTIHEISSEYLYTFHASLSNIERIRLITSDSSIETNWRILCRLLHDRNHELETKVIQYEKERRLIMHVIDDEIDV